MIYEDAFGAEDTRSYISQMIYNSNLLWIIRNSPIEYNLKVTDSLCNATALEPGHVLMSSIALTWRCYLWWPSKSPPSRKPSNKGWAQGTYMHTHLPLRHRCTKTQHCACQRMPFHFSIHTFSLYQIKIKIKKRLYWHDCIQYNFAKACLHKIYKHN